MLLGSFRVVRLEPVHDSPLVELGAHVEHGAGEAARDFGDLLWRQLVENAHAHLNRFRQCRPDAEAMCPAPCDKILLFASELARQIEHDQTGRIGDDIAAHGLHSLAQRFLVIGVVRGFAVPPVGQDNAQRLVERRHRVTRMGAVIGRGGSVLAVNDSPMPRLQIGWRT